MVTVPAYSFSAPTRAWEMAAARHMPGVCAVLLSSALPGITRTPSLRQSLASVVVMVGPPEELPITIAPAAQKANPIHRPHAQRHDDILCRNQASRTMGID